MSEKKKLQLGMNPGTASYRLVKDILFKFIADTGQNSCYVCKTPMSRETFSIEHKTPWLDSESPAELFFDLNNIAFSHHSCNVGNARQQPAPCGGSRAYAKGCRCELCVKAKQKQYAKGYTSESRKERYLRTGR